MAYSLHFVFLTALAGIFEAVIGGFLIFWHTVQTFCIRNSSPICLEYIPSVEITLSFGAESHTADTRWDIGYQQVFKLDIRGLFI